MGPVYVIIGLPARSLHINHKAVLNVVLKHSYKGSLDIFATDHFNIGSNIVITQKFSISCVSRILPIDEPLMLKRRNTISLAG